MTPDESFDLVKHINDSCPHLKFKGLMSMGEIGNVEEFKEIQELKVKMLEKFSDIITDDEFMVSMGTS